MGRPFSQHYKDAKWQLRPEFQRLSAVGFYPRLAWEPCFLFMNVCRLILPCVCSTNPFPCLQVVELTVLQLPIASSSVGCCDGHRGVRYEQNSKTAASATLLVSNQLYVFPVNPVNLRLLSTAFCKCSNMFEAAQPSHQPHAGVLQSRAVPGLVSPPPTIS